MQAPTLCYRFASGTIVVKNTQRRQGCRFSVEQPLDLDGGERPTAKALRFLSSLGATDIVVAPWMIRATETVVLTLLKSLVHLRALYLLQSQEVLQLGGRIRLLFGLRPVTSAKL